MVGAHPERVYLDTSGILAYLDRDDTHHLRAKQAWKEALLSTRTFLMTEYVRLECWSLVQRRLGLEALEDYHQRILPICVVETIDEERFHQLARQTLLLKRKKLSLVDLSSFDAMQRNHMQHALAFDRHFLEMGFKTPDQEDWLA